MGADAKIDLEKVCKYCFPRVIHIELIHNSSVRRMSSRSTGLHFLFTSPSSRRLEDLLSVPRLLVLPCHAHSSRDNRWHLRRKDSPRLSRVPGDELRMKAGRMYDCSSACCMSFLVICEYVLKPRWERKLRCSFAQWDGGGHR